MKQATRRRHTFKIENVRDAKGLEKELKGDDVSSCFFHDLIADEAIEKGKASKVMLVLWICSSVKFLDFCYLVQHGLDLFDVFQFG